MKRKKDRLVIRIVFRNKLITAFPLTEEGEKLYFINRYKYLHNLRKFFSKKKKWTMFHNAIVKNEDVIFVTILYESELGGKK